MSLNYMYNIKILIRLNLLIGGIFEIQRTCLANQNLDSVLKRFDWLKPSDLLLTHHVTKRSSAHWMYEDHSLDEYERAEKRITFTALDREFKLRLYEGSAPLSNQLDVRVVTNNESTSFVPDITYYEGFLEGEPRSRRSLVFWDDEFMTAVIKTRNDTYYVEPYWRNGSNSTLNQIMIVYRESDVKRDFNQSRRTAEHSSNQMKSFCNTHTPPTDLYNDTTSDSRNVSGFESETHGSRERSRRQTDGATRKVCSVMLVADYKFYESVGQNSASLTSSYMIGVITRVNDLYRSTEFGSLTGLGFEIKGLLIHSQATNVSSGQIHYNMQTNSWKSQDLLNAFSTVPDWSQYCLSHLFTYTSFEDSILGLSWVASSQQGSLGGICSPCSNGRCYNTGWTTALNQYGRMLVTLETDLITAHEFGHNWGSQHDPDDTECSPGSMNGGKYLMYQYAVSGYQANNQKFSPCSRRTISSVLDAKRQTCFTAESGSYCGNSRKEGGEECDGGLITRKGSDPCCTPQCTLKTGANCSDSNSVCCMNCQPAPSSRLCRPKDQNSCTDDTYCNGLTSECPNVKQISDNTPCYNGGRCKGGQCLDVCVYQGLQACVCGQNECSWCCNSSADGACKLYTNNSLPVHLPDGAACSIGVCVQGQCKKQSSSGTVRLWDYIRNLNPHTALIFLRNNVVIVTILLSLPVYLPFCFFLSYKDHKKLKKDRNIAAWHNSSNKSLIYDENANNIVKVEKTVKRSGTST